MAISQAVLTTVEGMMYTTARSGDRRVVGFLIQAC